MNLEGKIDLIKDSVTDIKQAILNKGVTPSGNLSTYADAIDTIVTPYNQTKSVTSNGVVRYDEGYTGLEQVTVNVNQSVQNKTITDNGSYTADSGYIGLGTVTVDVQPDLTTKTITANGTYNASSDSADGYSSVTVNVANPAESLINGSITIVDTGVSSIRGGAFANCEDLDTVILRSNTVVDLSDESIFANTPIASKTGNIYVPSDLLSSYKESYTEWITPIQNANLGQSNNGWHTVYGMNKFVALNNSGKASESSDGINWNTSSSIGNSYTWRDLTFDSYNRFVGVASAYNNYCYTTVSGDGTHWTTGSNLTDLKFCLWVSITNNIYKYTMLGRDNHGSGSYYYTYIVHSDDGDSWGSPIPISELTGNYDWTALCYGNGKYVALSESGDVAVSANAETNWTLFVSKLPLPPQTGYTHSWVKVIYENGAFRALSNFGYMSTSTDGLNWTTPSPNSTLSSASHTWSTIAYGNNKLVVLANGSYVSSTLTKYNFLPIT